MEDYTQETGDDLVKNQIPAAVHIKDAHLNSIESIAAHPDGREIASGSHDHMIKIWEVETGKQQTQL